MDNDEKEAIHPPLVQGSLWRAIWIMSWPLLLTTISNSISGFVDVQMAGTLGSTQQASVGLSEQIVFLYMVFIMSLGVGTTAIVSREFGAKNKQAAVYSAGQSLALSAVAGVFLALTAILTAHLLLPLFSQADDVIKSARIYLSILSFLLIPFSIVCIIGAAFRAIGDAKTPLAVIFTVCLVIVAGDYLTVKCNWPVPALGIKGIAYSALLASTIGSIIAIWQLKVSPLKDCFAQFFPFSWTEMKRVIHIGLPTGFQRLSWGIGTTVLFFILSRCPNPTEALASWTIGMRVESFVFMPPMALSMAVASIVGQNIGAKEYDRATRAGWHVAGIGFVLLLFLATGLFLFAEPLAKIMSHDARTIDYAVSYLRINALAEPALAINMVLSGALQGAGDTRAPMWISIFGAWIVRLPLAALLALYFHMGPSGAWISMAVSICVSCLLVALRFQSKAWIKARV